MNYAWEENEEDPMLEEARTVIKQLYKKKATISYLMKRLSIGYPRARRLMTLLKNKTLRN